MHGLYKEHRIVGSQYRTERKDLDSLKKEIGDRTTHNISFIEIYELNNLNMIDLIGSEIKKMFMIQREIFFPMPTYDISNERHTEVTIYGEQINVNYSCQLKKHPELSLDDVIALDKVQKKISNIIVEISTKDKKIVNISKSIKALVWALVKSSRKISNKTQ